MRACALVPAYQAERSVGRVVADLKARGHQITVTERGSTDYGRAQLIQKLDDGYVAGSEPRCDGQAVGF